MLAYNARQRMRESEEITKDVGKYAYFYYNK